MNERPLLSMVSIVKNEAASIKGVIEAALPFIDRGLIVDTGSTDGTQEIVRQMIAEGTRIPIEIVEQPFIGCKDLEMPHVVDFAATRNMALDLDKSMVMDVTFGGRHVPPAVFQIMLSGDEYLRNGDRLRAALEERREARRCKITGNLCGTDTWVADDCCPCDSCQKWLAESTDRVARTVDLFWLSVIVNGMASAPQPRVFRTDSAWRYRDEVHEFPTHPDEKALQVNLPDVIIEHNASDHEGRLSNIWDNHIPVLKAMLQRDPKYPRALIFLAQSYVSLLPFMEEHEQLMYALEIMGLYIRRLALPFPAETERLHVEIQYLDTATRVGVYTKAEMYLRARALAEAAPRVPELALLRAEAAMGAPPSVLGVAPEAHIDECYELFCVAAEVAKAARTQTAQNEARVYDLTVEWRAHRFAVIAMVQVAKKFPPRAAEALARARGHIADGLEAGGNLAVFGSVIRSIEAAEDALYEATHAPAADVSVSA